MDKLKNPLAFSNAIGLLINYLVGHYIFPNEYTWGYAINFFIMYSLMVYSVKSFFQNKKSNTEIATSNATNSELHKELESSKATNSELRKELESSKATNSELRKELESSKATNSVLQSKNSDLEIRITLLSGQLDSVKNQKDEWQTMAMSNKLQANNESTPANIVINNNFSLNSDGTINSQEGLNLNIDKLTNP